MKGWGVPRMLKLLAAKKKSKADVQNIKEGKYVWFVDQPGGEARRAHPGPGVGSEAEGQLPAEAQHAASQQRHAVPAAPRRPRRAQ